ncbi:myosin light chain kinase A-like isoform X2 [Schistocerca gregaria]|uniref:myosin light chain kinase A-like isoform X2 n=1 Tax=Schistocerca gregaria TaxID=7010 RepID=UPI00211DF0DE|nr:myosin light chain kinase A-like isoform X2 [Schistocerca gregaria]XP_049849743.1 myosin light chain kinase A-like isoform X2 [Schistocerca gregaria]XP_049849744.1 myosin light chain kinase A-like isoform X2 [Schistocerca gregaria]
MSTTSKKPHKGERKSERRRHSESKTRQRHREEAKPSIGDFYEIEDEVLGSGYFAIVMLGKDKRTGEKVAIKVITKSKVENPQFQNEINIMSKVSHPNVVGLRAVFDTSAKLFIVMELVQGGELYELISKRKRFSEEETSYIMCQVFSALKYIHNIGIVHRDLKLENMLLVDKDGLDIKLADFGLSKLYAGQALKTACGTPFYVAPDILQGSGYGPAVDMWSCGVITYVLLSGRLPFHANNDAELFQLIIQGNLVFKSPQFDTVSEKAKDLIRRLLVVNPERRYTAEQALQHPFVRDMGGSKFGLRRDEPISDVLKPGSELLVEGRSKNDGYK